MQIVLCGVERRVNGRKEPENPCIDRWERNNGRMEQICRCSQCGGRFKVDAKYLGRRVKCPKCGEVSVVTADTSPETPGDRRPAATDAAANASGEGASGGARFHAPPNASMDDAVTAPDLGDLQDLAKPAASTPAPTPTKSPAKPGRTSSTSTPVTARPLPTASALPTPASVSGSTPVRPAEPSEVDGGFKIQFEGGERSSGGIKTTKPSKKKSSKSNPMTMVIIGGIGGLLLVVGAIFLVAFYASRGNTPIASAKPTSLVIDLPETDRKGSAVTIDGKRRDLAASGPVEFVLEPGQHKLVIQRRGFEMIEFGFSLRAGEKFPYHPEWKPLGLSAVDPISPKGSGPPGKTTPTNPDISPPAVGPVGFTGWYQSLEMAQRLAKSQRKDILMAFVGSDWSQASMDMAEKLLSTPEFRRFAESRFVLVVIDLPRTEAGYNQLENSAQNRELVETYLVRQVPMIVLLDADARPFAIDGAFDESLEKYLQHLNRMASAHGARNDLFAAAAMTSLPDDQRLKKAEAAVTWLRENRLLRYYQSELSAWHRLATRLDDKNQLGQLEVFFEADWMVRLASALIDRKSGPVKRQLADLLAWSRDHKFTDPDRGVRLHLTAFQLALGMRDDTVAGQHVELAGTYMPKDVELQKELNDARRAVAGSNQLSSGTAFVVGAEGYLLTNYHVVEGPGKTVIRLPGKQETAPAEIVDRDEERDMALLKVDPAAFGQLKPLGLTVNPVKRASSVAVFGFPLGDDIARDIRITTGVVSALPDQSDERMLLLDCRVNPGNSGGPVFQRDGSVIGMITAKTSGGFGVESYGMALPTADLAAFLKKHIPELALANSSPGAAREWEQIDEDVAAGNSVLMVLKLRQ